MDKWKKNSHNQPERIGFLLFIILKNIYLSDFCLALTNKLSKTRNTTSLVHIILLFHDHIRKLASAENWAFIIHEKYKDSKSCRHFNYIETNSHWLACYLHTVSHKIIASNNKQKKNWWIMWHEIQAIIFPRSIFNISTRFMSCAAKLILYRFQRDRDLKAQWIWSSDFVKGLEAKNKRKIIYKSYMMHRRCTLYSLL